VVARAAALLSALALCACTDYTATGGEFFGEMARATCSSYERCGDIAPADFEMCVDVQGQLMCERRPGTCGSLITLSAPEWYACLDALENIDCSQLRTGILPSACASLDQL
jgi:hypothetical protein